MSSSVTGALFEARCEGLLRCRGLAVSADIATSGLPRFPAPRWRRRPFLRGSNSGDADHWLQQKIAAGVVAAAGTLASLIPPSAILVIYAIIVEQDFGKLPLAGFVPGWFPHLIYAGLSIGMAALFKNIDPPFAGFTWRQRLQSLPAAPHSFLLS